MILRARQDGDVLVFELEGHLDFETTLEFKNACDQLIKSSQSPRVIFNMEKLRFVGSSSINQFIRIMKEFNSPKYIKPKPKLCQVSREFERVFRAYQTTRNPFDIFESEKEAVTAFDIPVPAPVKKLKRQKTLNN